MNFKKLFVSHFCHADSLAPSLISALSCECHSTPEFSLPRTSMVPLHSLSDIPLTEEEYRNMAKKAFDYCDQLSRMYRRLIQTGIDDLIGGKLGSFDYEYEALRVYLRESAVSDDEDVGYAYAFLTKEKKEAHKFTNGCKMLLAQLEVMHRSMQIDGLGGEDIQDGRSREFLEIHTKILELYEIQHPGHTKDEMISRLWICGGILRNVFAAYWAVVGEEMEIKRRKGMGWKAKMKEDILIGVKKIVKKLKATRKAAFADDTQP